MTRAAALSAMLALAGCGPATVQRGPEQLAGPPPDVAELVCGKSGPELRTPVVRARRDGVHVRVTNENDVQVEFDYEVTRGDTGGGGSVAPPGTSQHVVPFGAEEVSLGCAPESLVRVDLRVVDPGNELKTADLECARYDPSPPRPPKSLRGGDPVAIARRFLRRHGLRPGDRVERAVSIAEEFPRVRVVRDGRTVAAVWFDDPETRHGVGTVEMCAGFDE